MSLLDGLKSASDLAYHYKQMDLYEQIMALREEALAIREENIELREEVARLKQSATTQLELVRDGNSYFKKDDTQRKHPFCLTCWDHDQKLISQTLVSDPMDSQLVFIHCGICNSR